MKSLLFPKKYFLNLRSFSTILFLVLFSPNLQAQCPTIDVIDDPQEFVWKHHPVTANNPEAYYSGTMEVGEVTLDLNNGETLTTRAYRQKGTNYTVPGPTIIMKPGNKYVLSLENTLPYEVPSTSHNVFKDPNIVNLHTHGLHISGMTPGDDVTRFFEGGYGGDFVYDIPDDHMGGTFWYHAHHHGSTLLQVAGGMFGMLLIDDANDGMPDNVANMKEKVLAIGFLDPGVQGTGGDTLISGSLSPSWTVNGIIGGNLCIPDNTWEHWRVLIADRGAKLRDVELGPGLEVMVLARDGVWRTTAPKELATNNNTLQLTGASRADFAIRKIGAGASWIKVGGNIVANIYTSDGATDLTVNPYNTDGVSPWSATRPEYLRDLRSVPNVNNVSISMGARTIKGPDYGGKFDHMKPNVTLGVTDVQEWSLSGNVQHPFHLHVYHVQAMEDDRDFEAGEYYDVVASQMDVRFDLNSATSTPYDGRTIMHCHILSHEDQGAMGWLDVDGGTGAPTFPIDGDIATAYDDYYVIPVAPQIPSAPSSLSATAISSSAIDLAWTDNASDENAFNIERSEDGTTFSALTTVGADVTAYNNTGLTESTTYYYRVSASNDAGTSIASNVANATTDAIPQIPAAPTSLSATPASSSAIDLVWADNASDEEGFNIERSSDGANFSALTTVGANVTAYNDGGLTASTAYYYRVSAYNLAGTSATSNVANATTDALPQPPAAPSNLSATVVSDTEIDLVWTDNASDEDGFSIERSLDGTNFIALTTVGENVTVYSDNGLTASTTYYYRVTSFNSGGNSAPSNVDSDTTEQSNGGPVMHVQSISIVRLNLNGNRSQAEAKIAIYDSSNQPVSGATVAGNFTGPSSSSESGTTNTNGEVTFSTRALKNPVGVWCFEVTDINLTGATYDVNANEKTSACEVGTAKKSITKAKEISSISLNQYPNPFKTSTQITFQLPEQKHVVLEVYTVLGKRIKVLTNQNYEAGQYIIDWNAQKLAAGMYFLQMRANGKQIDTKRLILVH